MPDSEKWLTVSQFARLAGVSPQTIYKQLSTRLSTHSKEENGSKYINSDALQLFGLSTDSTQVVNRVVNRVVNPNQPSCQPDSTPENDGLQHELDRLRAELAQVTADRDAAREQRDKAEIRAAAADAESKRADAAEAQLIVKDQQIQQQSDRIGDLTAALRAAQDQNRELTSALTAAQALNAGTMQMLMQKAAPEPVTASQRADEPQGTVTPQEKQEPLREPQDVREDAAAPSGSEPPKKRPGLFARIFRRERK